MICFITLIQVQNPILHFNIQTLLLPSFSDTISQYLTVNLSFEPTISDDYFPSDDPNIINLIVSQYDCENHHNLRQFNLLNVKQFIQTPSKIKHTNGETRIYFRAIAKRVEAFKCESSVKKKKEWLPSLR